MTNPEAPVKKKLDPRELDKWLEQELADEDKGDPNKLFKDIFARADPDTRRAMMKSYQTSGGTVLSTNWQEVSRADYEGKDKLEPPEGQEWRSWTGKK